MQNTEHPYSHNYAVTAKTSIDLRLSENPLGPSPQVIKAIKAAAKNTHLYPCMEKELITAIANHHQIDENCILLGAGANQLIEDYLKVYALGKNIVIPSANFLEPMACISTLHGSVSTVHLNTDFSLNLTEMLKKCREETAFIHLCNPNNPTGIWTNTAKILDVSKKSLVPLLISEAGADFVGETMISSVRQNNIIVIRSFSKAYGLAGLRIGYSIASPDVIENMKGNLRPYQANSLSIVAAIAALQDQEYLQKSICYIMKEKEWLVKEMLNIGFMPINSQGQNFIAKVPEKFSGATEFCNLIRKCDVAVVDCSLYPGLNQYIRISPKLHRTNQLFVRCVKELI